jgi:hypothetical protein
MQARLTIQVSVCFVVVMCLLIVAPALAAEALHHDLKIEKILDTSGDVGDIVQTPEGEIWVLERRTGSNGVIHSYRNGDEVSTLNIPVSTSCDNGLMDVAFAPDYNSSGLAFVYYVDGAGVARVARLLNRGTQLGASLITIGATTTDTDGKCHAGGGMDVGADGLLYVATGDLGVSSNAQNDASLAGKVLRTDLDGGDPGNLSGTLVWAKGFRDPADLDIHSNGTVYVSDVGHDFPDPAPDVFDELNAVHEGGNYAWDVLSGDDPFNTYDEPMHFSVGLGLQGIEMLENSGLGGTYEDSLVYACEDVDDMRQGMLSGGDLDKLDSWNLLFDPDGDYDGIADTGCPASISAVTEGRDGMIYGANAGRNPGVWRIYHDEAGPREVSAPGSPLQLTMGKSGANVELYWEDLGVRDASYPDRPGGQSPALYQIYRGTLPIAGAYTHSLYFGMNGTSVGVARLKSPAFPPGAGDEYYLMAAQNENLRGLTGSASDGTARGPVVAPGTENQFFAPMLDYCPDIGWGRLPGQCARPFYDPNELPDLVPMTLVDYNPNSQTYLQNLNLTDFRGKVIRMDISAVNCTFCNLQAPFAQEAEEEVGGRDVIGITVLTETFQTLLPITPANCASRINTWATNHGVTGPILCDVDTDGNNRGDVSSNNQWFRGNCGTPQNHYIDQAGVVYLYVCGGELNTPVIRGRLANEVNAETCD